MYMYKLYLLVFLSDVNFSKCHYQKKNQKKPDIYYKKKILINDNQSEKDY